MPMHAEEIQNLIQKSMPKARITIQSLADDNDHFSVCIINPDFEGMPLVQQHQAVYKALGGRMGTDLHALSISTKSHEDHI